MLPVLATDSVSEDLSRAVGYALMWGLEGVAVGSVGGERVPFVNEVALRRRLELSEMPLAAAEPGLFEGDAGRRAVWLNDVAAFDDTAAFCRRMGCGVVRVGALGAGGEPEQRVEALRALGDAAGRAGLVLAVRHGADTAVASASDLATLLAAVGHPAVGADWRPAESPGEVPLDGLDALLGAGCRVACVGVADAQTADDGARVGATVGAGDMGWDAVLVRLAASGFDGPLALRVDGRPSGPAGLASGSALVRLIRTARRAAAP